MMEAGKDNSGFEMQKTVPPADEQHRSIPTELPKVPESGNSTQGPPKPSKSSTMPTNANNGQSKVTVGSVENGNTAAAKAREAEPVGLALNAGYFKSWQAILKCMKMVCFIAMIVSLSIPVRGISKIPRIPATEIVWSRMPALQYGLAVSVIGLITELALFLVYLLGLNSFVIRILPKLLAVGHTIMFILIFVAPIVLTALDVSGPSIAAFLVFDIIAVAGYTLELYFNIVWLTGGPELACFPLF